jgi:hypothetical protein
MALGTTALTSTGGADAGQVNCDRITVVLDNSYPTGGYSGLAAKITGVTNRTPTILGLVGQGTDGYVFTWNYATSKLMAWYGNYDAADGVLIQVPDTTDLSAVTAQLLVFYK